MLSVDEDLLVPLVALAIPLVALAGWLLAGVLRTISAHRLLEAAVQERIALIARGVEPARIPRAAAIFGGSSRLDAVEYDRRRAQGLFVWGLALFAGGVTLAVVSGLLEAWDSDNLTLGVIAASIGIALLLGSAIVWPRRRG